MDVRQLGSMIAEPAETAATVSHTGMRVRFSSAVQCAQTHVGACACAVNVGDATPSEVLETGSPRTRVMQTTSDRDSSMPRSTQAAGIEVGQWEVVPCHDSE